ncbi:MAG: AI-2E family transporter [Salaquimonas sp.]|nr:AI-2E family transporter [Salaquimonas sp.]
MYVDPLEDRRAIPVGTLLPGVPGDNGLYAVCRRSTIGQNRVSERNREATIRASTLTTITLALALSLMIGWLLVIGRGLLLPILLAVIVVYVLSSTTNALKRLPLLRHLPATAIHLVLLAVVTLVFVALALVISTTVNQLIEVAPSYQKNLETLATQFAHLVNVDDLPNWHEIRAATLEKISIQTVLLGFVSGLTSMGSSLFLVIVYAAFLFSERISFTRKVSAAFPDGGQAERLMDVLRKINSRIGNYLAIKTLINVILGIVSFAIMWLMGVDFALFWAVTIALMNYIPYFGSLIGVMLPVILSLAQFASISTTLMLAVLLTAAQMWVGNFLEPRMIGRGLNMSPFVVITALSLWTGLWGLPGAILAIPLTSMIAIILGGFEGTRFIAVLLSERVDTSIEEAAFGDAKS